MGAAVFTKTLFCNNDDNFFQINPSLYAALREFRDLLVMRRLWVDAVCINQQDNKEKSYQIRFMPKLYREARHVLIWVGEDSHGGSKTNSIFKRTLRDAWRMECGDADARNNAITNFNKRVFAKFGNSSLDPIQRFFLRDWFRRRWIIQEVVLAETASIHCGSTSMDFVQFAWCAQVFNNFIPQNNDILESRPLFHDHVAKVLSSLIDNHHSKHRREPFLAGTKFPILELLRDFHPAQCSDERDRIYALMGLCNDLFAESGIEHIRENRSPDFKRAVLPITHEEDFEEVFTSLALRLMSATTTHAGISNVLHIAATFNSANRTLARVPSWVPDWSAPMRFLPLTRCDFFVGPLPKDRGPNGRSIDRKTLCLRGWVHSTICGKLDGFPESPSFQQLRHVIQQWWRFYNNKHKDVITATNSPHQNLGYGNFFNCVTVERMDGYISSAVIAPLLDVEPNNHISPKTVQSIRKLNSLIRGRSLFTSDNRVIMNCPDNTGTGDLVVNFKDVNTQFVIRPTGRYTEPTGRSMRTVQRAVLIGNCYFEGLMNVKSEDLGNATQFLLE